MTLPTLGQGIGGAVGLGLSFLIPGVGPIIGFTIGLGIGTLIDPPKIEEPEASPFALQDLQFNSFAKNFPVPIIYGINRVGGNVVFIGNTRTTIIEHPVEGPSKGGPPDPPPIQETRFGADFAVALSEGPIQGVAQTWVDDDDISAREGLNFTVFVGSNTQVPPSEMITALGSDAPAFRNLAYSLFTGDLGNVNRVPLINQLVSGIEGGISPQTEDIFSKATVNRAIGIVCFEDKQEICMFHSIQDGGIYRTIDGSKTTAGWSQVHAPTSFTGLHTIKMIGVHPGVTGRAYCFNGGTTGRKGMVRTENYGATWGNSVNTDGDITFVKGVRNNSSEVVMGWDNPEGMAKSFDGGLTYTMQQSIASNGGFQAVFNFPGTDVWMAPTRLGRMFRSTDNGNSYVDTGQDTENQCLEGQGVTDQIGVTGHTEAIFRTVDQGLTWTKVLGSAGDASGGSRLAINQDTLILYRHARITADCEMFVSTDLGATWTCGRSFAPQSRDLFSTEFNHCWIGQSLVVTCEHFTIPTTCGNPAEVISDFLSNTRYGLGLSSATIDNASFASTANFCTGNVEVSSGTFEQRFCLDIVLDRGKPVLDHLRDMLATFRGFLTWSQGIVKLQIEREEPISQTFDMGNIIDGSFVWRKQSYRDRPNIVKVEFIEPGNNNDYRLDFAQAFDDWDIDQSGERRERIFRLIGIKRRSQAQRMAQFYLDQAIHIVHAISFRVGIAALQSEVGDVVEVSHDVPAFNQKQFRLMEISEAENDELQLTLLEYNEDIYKSADQTTEAEDDRTQVQDLFAVPYHAARLTAHQRPVTNEIEVSLTRVATNDLLSAERFFIQRNGSPFDAIGESLPIAPTAFIDSDVRCVTQITTGVGSGPPPMDAAGGGYVALVIADSPYAYWRLDEASGTAVAADEIGNTHPMSYRVNVNRQVEALIDDLLDTDSHYSAHIGSGGNVGHIAMNREIDTGLPNIGSFRSTEFSAEAWIESPNWDDFSDSFYGVFGLGRGECWNLRVNRQSGGGQRKISGQFFSSAGQNVFFNGITSLELDTLYHLVMTKEDSGGAARLYVNATLENCVSVGSGNTGGPIQSIDTFLMLGRTIPTGGGSRDEANIFIDEVAYYPFALSQEQVSNHFTTAVSPTGAYVDIVKADSPSIYWKHDEIAVTSGVIDQMGFHSVGSFRGQIIAAQSGIQSTAHFFGSGGNPGLTALNETLSGSFRSQEFTTEAWFRSDSFQQMESAPSIVGMRGEWLLFIENDVITFLCTDSANTQQRIGGTTVPRTPVPDNTWHYVAGVHTDSYMSLFMGNVTSGFLHIHSAALTKAIEIRSAAGKYSVARRDSVPLGQFGELRGAVDEIAYYPFALTSAQLLEHYTVAVSPGETGGDPGANSGWIEITGIPDQWTGHLHNPDDSVERSVISSFGATLIFSISDITQPFTGYIRILSSPDSVQVEGGRIPIGVGSHLPFQSGDEFDYVRQIQEITATQTFIPIFSPKGGFANVASARVENEQMGYATFTDSRLEGVTRGAGNTVATSHTNLASLEAAVILSGDTLGDFSLGFTDPKSFIGFFGEQSQYLYLGASSKFSLVDALLTKNATPALGLSYEYSTGDGVFASLTASGFIPVFDETSGFTRSGKMFFEPPGDWSPTATATTGVGTLADGTSRYFLRILNTVTAAIAPVELNFFLDGEMIFACRKTTAFIYATTLIDSGQTLTFKAISVGGRGPQVQDGTKSPVFTIQESSS